MADGNKHDIIVIGGSADSSAVLKDVLSDLPRDLGVSVFVSTHIPSHSPSLLADVLGSSSSLPVSQAVDGQPVERGRVYVAAPDRHLLLLNGNLTRSVK
ncbi:chemotaxis protein CheB [Sphingomonas sp. DT-51]|uniref:chemotaxis protein CheB n=1 Tax=Sphingomonas sp. DT-51 TaxID=3396165 RepID=UPI003F1AD1DF